MKKFLTGTIVVLVVLAAAGAAAAAVTSDSGAATLAAPAPSVSFEAFRSSYLPPESDPTAAG